TTLGLYLLVLGVCAAFGIAGPGEFPGRFSQVAGIWVERNVMLRDTEWPRQTHLEFIGFKESPEERNSMRVPQEEHLRPDLWVRPVKWVYHAGDGWRALRWKDLDGLIDPKMADIKELDGWSGWRVDFDELDPMILPGMLSPAWKGKSVGEVKASFAQKD